MTGQHSLDHNKKSAIRPAVSGSSSIKKNAVLQRSLSQPAVEQDRHYNKPWKQIGNPQIHWQKIKRLAFKRLNTYSGDPIVEEEEAAGDGDGAGAAGMALSRQLEYNQLPGALLFAMMAQRDESGHPRIPVLLSLVKVQINGVETTKVSNMKISRKARQFCIVVSYGNTQWIIHRRHWDFIKLHYSYYGYDLAHHTRRPTAGLPVFPSMAYHRHKQGTQQQKSQPNRRSSLYSIERHLSTNLQDIDEEHNKRITTPASLSTSLSESYIDKQQQQRHDKRLENYMAQLIQATLHTGNVNRLCKFLELSALGLHLKATQPQGHHGKEGYMAIMARTDRGPTHSRRWHNILQRSNSTEHHQLKWFIVRDNYIVCVNHPHDIDYYDVLLFEPGFQIQRGYTRSISKWDKLKLVITSAAKLTMGHSTLCLKTHAGEIYLRARNVHQAIQFEESLLRACRQSSWCLPPQRFNSFAPVRPSCPATWFVDGKDYFWQVSEALENATKHIYIHDWWLSPELYLRRPPSENEKWRLDRVLKRKAEQGVKIYIIVYKEVALAVPIFSHHTKRHLLSLSKNIFVQRHPSRTLDILSKQEKLFFAHHEKICLVDGVVAFIGGLDLCYGRYDTANHTLTDDPPTVNAQTWPGKDYSNPRIDDFHSLDKPFDDHLDRASLPRMPWHDIALRVCGEAARDVERHFVQRWNFLHRRKYSRGGGPKRHIPMILPSATTTIDMSTDPRLGGLAPCSMHTQVQILRSVSSWSSGVETTEHSIMDAYVDLIGASKHFVYIENQFFITSAQCGTTVIENKIGDALYNRILRAHQNNERWSCVVIMPLVPEFPGNFSDANGSTIRLIMNAQYLSIGRGPTSLLARLRAAGVTRTADYIQFYGLRTWGKLNGSYVTEQVYVHAKAMIVDDRTVVIGSANINERSMLGVRDSEICACIEDTEMIDSAFAGQPVQVGRFAHSLRLRLMAEHLGLPVDEWDAETLLHHATHTPSFPELVTPRQPHQQKRILDHATLQNAVMADDNDGNKRSGRTTYDSGIEETADDDSGTLSCDTDNNGDGLDQCTPVTLPKCTDLTHYEREAMMSMLRDPLVTTTQHMWLTRARYNTDLFRQCFMVLPDNSVRTWAGLSAFSKLSRQASPHILDKIKGHLVVWPMNFMADEGDNFVFAMDRLAPLEIFD